MLRKPLPAWVKTALLWALPVIFLLFFYFYPLGKTFRLSAEEAFSIETFTSLLHKVGQPVAFTFWQASLSSLITLLIGLPLAYIFARYDFFGKSFLRLIIMIPFILPTVVVAAALNALVGPNGWVNIISMQLFNLAAPPIQIMNSFTAILIAHVFFNTTIVIRVVGSSLAQLDPRLEMAAKSLGASPFSTLTEIIFPLAKPAIYSAAILVFMFDFTSFGVILMLGGPHFSTIETEIYIQAMQMLNLPLAGLLSAIQLFCTLIFMVLYSRLTRHLEIPISPRLSSDTVRPIKTFAERFFVFLLVSFAIVFYLFPLFALIFRSITVIDSQPGSALRFSLVYYQELFINRRQALFYVPPITAALNSIRYGIITTLISVSLGFLSVYALSRKSKINNFLDPIFMLPLGTSAVTLGLGFMLVFNHPPFDVRSFPMVIPLAHSLVALPFVIRSLQPALNSIPPSLRQAAAVLGASPWQVLREIDFPIMLRSTLVAAIFSFTISLGEFGATSFLSRPEYPTLPIAIYRLFLTTGFNKLWPSHGDINNFNVGVLWQHPINGKSSESW